MGFISRLMGRSPANPPRSRLPSQPPSQHSRFPSQLSQPPSQQSLGASHNGMRKELLRVVLRDILNRNGIPKDWISADMLGAAAATPVPGIHLRLVIRHWDPRLLVHGVAFQQKIQQRVVMLDPTAVDWLLSISWLFALDDVSDCPALPHPGVWTAEAGPGTAPASSRKLPPGVRADLDMLLTVRDEELRRHAQAEAAAGNFAATEPGGLYTLPDPPPR